MSVNVKTPTKTQFEQSHQNFPCDTGRTSLSTTMDEFGAAHGEAINIPSTSPLQDIVKSDMDFGIGFSGDNIDSMTAQLPPKKKFRERGGSFHLGSRKKPGRSHKTGEKTVLPSKFLLGGNITDPLNLNALYTDDFGKMLNQSTPQSSPLPLPSYKQEVQVLIPPNINDPLNLNADEEGDPCLISPKCSGKKKKHKHSRKRRSTEANIQTGQTEQSSDFVEKVSSRELSYDEKPSDLLHSATGNEPEDFKKHSPEAKTPFSQVCSAIVSKITGQKSSVVAVCPKPAPKEISVSDSSCGLPPQSEKPLKQDAKHHGSKPKKFSNMCTLKQQAGKKGDQHVTRKFVYGNYDRYYGYRNPGDETDSRLACLQSEWFKGKDILDIGCNIGHITLTIARDYKPRRITGVDIDGKLVSIAKKNIRHYMSSQIVDTRKFPTSLTRHPIAAPPCVTSSSQSDFPHNVMFMQGNYVLDTDEELDLVQEEYDTILALSITKWLHLNFGDDGLKRAFRRMHKQLRPGGKLVLEPQPYASYKKKKKLSDTTLRNFQGMRFRPEQFTEYLLSREVGFIACEHLDPPCSKSQGFQRPLQVYTKAESGSTPAEGVTPLMEIHCTPCTTPQLSSSHHYIETSIGTPPMFDMGPST